MNTASRIHRLGRLCAVRSASAPQKRMMGDWLKKNIHIEENAGMREHTLHDFRFTPVNVLRIIGGLFVPAILLYNLISIELEERDKFYQRKEPRKFGFVPLL